MTTMKFIAHCHAPRYAILHSFSPSPPFVREGGSHAALSPDGRHLGLVRSADFAVVWDLQTGKEKLRFTEDIHRRFEHCQFSADGKEFLCENNGRMAYWNLTTKKLTRKIPGEEVARVS